MEVGPDDIDEDDLEGAPAVRLGDAAKEPSQSGGDSAGGLAPSLSGQYDSMGPGTEGQCNVICCVYLPVLCAISPSVNKAQCWQLQ